MLRLDVAAGMMSPGRDPADSPMSVLRRLAVIQRCGAQNSHVPKTFTTPLFEWPTGSARGILCVRSIPGRR